MSPPRADAETSAPTPAGEAEVIESELGRVSYTLPPASFADPTPVRPLLPDFVVGLARWIVPDCCFLIVTLQNLEPPMAPWEVTNSFEANGIQWEVYDIGPEDGTQLTARGTVEPITVLVSVQGPVGKPAAGPPTQAVVTQVARSVVIDPITNG